MENVATIKVMYKPGGYEMIINESDFDEKIHEKIGVKAEKAVKANKAKKIAEDDEVKALIGEE